MAKPDYYGTSDGGETQSYKGQWLNFTYSELKSLVWRMAQWPGSTIARLSRSMGMEKEEICRGLDDLRTLGELGQRGNRYYLLFNDPDLIREYVGTIMAFGTNRPQPTTKSLAAAIA
jgi:hypothetical protein